MMDLKYEMAIAELDTAAAILDDLEEPVHIGAGVYIPYHMIWDCRHGHTPCTKIDFAGGKVVFEKVKPKWIPVEERLPENSGSYLVTVQNGNVYSATFDVYSKKFYCKATAWMPLPEAYKKDEYEI